jgi:hypothetical protein
MPAPEELSRQTLAETPGKVLAFLAAVGQSLTIRAALLDRGYTEAVHEHIWRLLLDTSGFRDPSTVDARVRAAILEVDQWDEPTFRLASAALRHEFPEQHEYLFADDLQPGTGAESLLSVTRFLDRLEALERGAERKSTRKVDAAALAKLAIRGITLEERARIRGLVDIARSSVAGTAEAMAQDRTAGRKSLEQLRALYEEWAEVARVVVKRRADLIRLGLARRKKHSKNGEADTEVEEETVTPPPVAVAPKPAPSPAPSNEPIAPAPSNGAAAPGMFEPRPA